MFDVIGNGTVDSYDKALLVLGLTEDTVSIQTARAAYRKQFRMYHPDKLVHFQGVNIDDLTDAEKEAEVAMQRAQAKAYAKLLAPAQAYIMNKLS